MTLPAQQQDAPAKPEPGLAEEALKFLQGEFPLQIDWTEDEPNEVGVWTIRGRNDREWRLVGQGTTVMDALAAALRSRP